MDVSDCTMEPVVSVCAIAGVEKEQTCDVSPASADLNPHDTEPQPVLPTHEDTITDEPAVCTHPQGFENTTRQTRQGRAIKLLVRLICEMNKQVIETPKSTVNYFFFC